MALVAPTLDQFKTQFYRAFPYSVPSFGATGTAVLTAEAVTSITLTAGGQFYQKVPLVQFSGGGGSGAAATAILTNNAVSGYTVTSAGSGYTEAPTITVVSQDGDETDISKVTNQDIEFALSMCPPNINPRLFGGVQVQYQNCYNLLAAHFLCTNLLNSTQGVKSQYDWLTNSRTIGNVQASFGIPDRVQKSAWFSTLTSTRYGAQYVGIIWPYLAGNVALACGSTTP